MARSNQTGLVVLGALSVTPMTGCALREAIRDVLGHFWSESFCQIYPTLAELERQGFVQRRGAARTHASMFSITRSGRARLKQLLSQPVQSVPPRNGLLLRLFFGRQIGPDACRSLVPEARADAQRRLGQFEAIRRELAQTQENAQDRPYWLLTLAAGEHAARAAIAWTDEALATLDRLGPPNKHQRRREERTER